MQPATINFCARPNFLYSAISRIDCTDSCCAGSMKLQVLTTSTSASPARAVISYPARARIPIITSLSTRFFGHPRLTNPTLGISVPVLGHTGNKQFYHMPRGARRSSAARHDGTFVNNRTAIVEYCRLPNRPEFDFLRVVLVATRNPLNIGAAARAMSNFGFLRLRLVNPYDVAFREARSAVGASALLASAEEFKTVAEAVADCPLVVGTTAVGSRGLQHSVRRLDAAARLIRKRLASSRVALLFGSEKFGLSNDDMSHCHWLLRIPTHEQNISMNLGQPAAVCLYELIRDGKTIGPPKSGGARPPNSGGKNEAL